MVFVFIALLIVLILLSLPIALALGVIGVAALSSVGETPITFPMMLQDGLYSFVILAVPLFIMTGEILGRGQVAARLIDFANALVGWIAGGLGHANIVTSMLFANVSGSAVADAASVGSILVPEMVRRGFAKDFSVVVTAYSASIGILIPPSIGMILYSIVSDVSIAKLFLAGYLPGVGYGVMLMFVTWVIAKRRNYPTHEPFSLKNVVVRLWRAWVALLIPITIVGGIVGGIFTPTEGAAVTASLSLIAALVIYRGMTIWQLPAALITVARRSANVLLLLGISSVFSHYLITQEIPQNFAKLIISWGLPGWQVLFVVIVFLVICGTFLHGAPMVLMMTPIFLPLIDAMGMDRVHFGLLFIFCIVIGEQTPPVASVMLTTCGVTNFPITKAWSASIPWFVMLFCFTLMIAYVPQISLLLPNYFLG
ncbi:MAG: TRAP transporter large permease [Alphaproteobacteria bacterium]